MTDRYDIIATEVENLIKGYRSKMNELLGDTPSIERVVKEREFREGPAFKQFWDNVDALIAKFDVVFPDKESRKGVWAACSDPTKPDAETLRNAGSDQARMAIILYEIAAQANIYPNEHKNNWSPNYFRDRFAHHWARLNWMDDLTAQMWHEIDQMKERYEDVIAKEQQAIERRYRETF